MQLITELCPNIYLIDCHDSGLQQRTGSYVLAEEQLTIIETSASPSVKHIIDGLESLNYSLDDVKYIIVTHIHLDHAGGAGLLLQKCPQATLIVHPQGYRHLVDPTRLIKGAQAVYGEQFEQLFDPIIPIPEERLIVKNDQEKLIISNDCTLIFYDTPGHANHHFSIYHPKSNGIFTGDTAGVRYPRLERLGIEFCLPSTSPNQFDPQKMLAAIDLYESLKVDKIFFGHYSMSSKPMEVYKQLREMIPIFVEKANQAVNNYSNKTDQISNTISSLAKIVTNKLTKLQVPQDDQVYDLIQLDLYVSSLGLIDYIHKKNKY